MSRAAFLLRRPGVKRLIYIYWSVGRSAAARKRSALLDRELFAARRRHLHNAGRRRVTFHGVSTPDASRWTHGHLSLQIRHFKYSTDRFRAGLLRRFGFLRACVCVCVRVCLCVCVDFCNGLSDNAGQWCDRN